MAYTGRQLFNKGLVNIGDTIVCTRAYSYFFTKGNRYQVKEGFKIEAGGELQELARLDTSEFEVVPRTIYSGSALVQNKLVKVGDRIRCKTTCSYGLVVDTIYKVEVGLVIDVQGSLWKLSTLSLFQFEIVESKPTIDLTSDWAYSRKPTEKVTVLTVTRQSSDHCPIVSMGTNGLINLHDSSGASQHIGWDLVPLRSETPAEAAWKELEGLPGLTTKEAFMKGWELSK